ADAVAMFFEIAVPAVIDGEKEFGGTRDIHGAEYKAELQSCKAPERRSRDARPVRALRSVIIVAVYPLFCDAPRADVNHALRIIPERYCLFVLTKYRA
ncbi:hypothetical protein, partial [Candidatus Erwinia dacicola]|uniref:hypothetical protein n=1 Tax=Candidatus Erwinia dacicola TaxID=252393 RepID=UPI001C992732